MGLSVVCVCVCVVNRFVSCSLELFRHIELLHDGDVDGQLAAHPWPKDLPKLHGTAVKGNHPNREPAKNGETRNGLPCYTSCRGPGFQRPKAGDCPYPAMRGPRASWRMGLTQVGSIHTVQADITLGESLL